MERPGNRVAERTDRYGWGVLSIKLLEGRRSILQAGRGVIVKPVRRILVALGIAGVLSSMVLLQGCAVFYRTETVEDGKVIKQFGLVGGLLPIYCSTTSIEARKLDCEK